jgi:hypothetical protein
MVVTIVGFSILLYRKGLFTILHTGPWVLLAVSIYFFYNPLAALISGDLALYQEALSLFTREGPVRVIWITIVIMAGLSSWLIFYVRKRNRVTERTRAVTPFSTARWSVLQVIVLLVFLIAAIYSLLYLRVAGVIVDSDVEVEFDQGRVKGETTGYSVVSHGFFLFITMILMLRGPTRARYLGLFLAIGFLALRLYDSHNRSSIVSLLAAIAMIEIVRARAGIMDTRTLLKRMKKNKVKSMLVLAGAAAMAVFLVVRGHSSIADVKEYDFERTKTTLQRNDTAMLPLLYAWSYVYEKEGYEYGLPFVGKVLFGYIPRVIAPWKDDITKWILGREQIRYNRRYERWLIGPKATILGSLYGNGGIVAVMIGMALLGMISGRLDRLVASGRTDLGRAIGVVLLANVWMMFGSGENWILAKTFVYAMPFLGLWIATKIEKKKRPMIKEKLNGKQISKTI